MKSSLGRQILLVAIVGAGLVLGTFIIWRLRLARDVESKLAALRAAGMPTSGEDLNKWYAAVPDSDNAALVMTQAFALIRNYPDSRSNEVTSFKIPPCGQRLTAEQKQLLSGYVETNAVALAKVREAIQLSKSRYPIDLSCIFNVLDSHLMQLRLMARIAEFQSLLALNSDRPAEADVSISTILELARTLDDEPVMLSQLTRSVLVSIAALTLEWRLNAGGLSEAEIGDLNSAFVGMEKNKLMARAFVGERAVAIPGFRISVAEIERREKSIEKEEMPNGPPLQGRQPLFCIITGFFERDLRFYLNAVESNIMFAGFPPPLSLDVTNFCERKSEEGKRYYYLLSAMTLPSLSRAVVREAECIGHIRLATTALAVERFRLAHGPLPNNLNELTLQFLPAVPTDPFDGKPLRYRRLAKGYVIYSIGSDGHDDGGREKPADWKFTDKKTYDITFTVER